jgi:hypothetical protein
MGFSCSDSRFLALKGTIVLTEYLAALGAMPGVDELARGFVFKRAADCGFHIVHWTPCEAHFVAGSRIQALGIHSRWVPIEQTLQG